MKHLLTMTALALLVLGVPKAHAANTSPQPLSPAVQHLVDSGSRIAARFMSSAGLRAVVAVNGPDRKLFYVTPDGRHLIFGAVFDAHGRNVTLEDMSRAKQALDDAAPPSPGEVKSTFDPTLDKLIDEASRLAWIKQGSRGKTIYAIFDPNCMYCHALHTQLTSLADAGKVQVRWIPVSILAASGPGLISAVYASSDPADALSRAFNHILPAAPVTPEAKLAMARNLLLLRDTGYAGVPVILYKKGGHVAIHKGLPDAQALSAMIGS